MVCIACIVCIVCIVCIACIACMSESGCRGVLQSASNPHFFARRALAAGVFLFFNPVTQDIAQGRMPSANPTVWR